jgi:UDP-N-acetylmuramoyl-tripeptide--D-alanyl-D-alanine ligase
MKEVFHRVRRFLAKVWLDINLQLTVVGVTGSYGKTSTVRAIAEVVSGKFSVNRTDLNLDTLYNLPITILKTKVWNEVLVLEYGVDRRNEMDLHLSLVKPKIAVLTGITPVHADEEHLGSLENVIAEKRKLVEAIPADGLAVFNFDDEIVKKVGEGFGGRKVFYGLKKGADVRAEKIKLSLQGTEFELQDGKEKLLVKTPLLGYPAVYTSLTAYIVGKELGVEKEKILSRLASLKPLVGRLSSEPGPLGTVLVNDARRANPASTIAGLKSLAEFPGRKVAVLGEMGELGEYSEKMHRSVGEEAAKLKLDVVVGIGPLTKFIIEAAQDSGMRKNQLFWAANVQEAAEILKKVLKKDDLLYLKASLLRHLERILLLLKGEEVCCTETVCHHYQPCSTCSRLKECVK